MTIINESSLSSTRKTEINREIKAWLVRRDLKQTDLGEGIGLTQTGISKRLSGRVPFTVEELLLVADYLEITLGELLGESVLNKKGPRPAMQDEGEECALRDSNPEPTD
ncbi:MAG: helix-turn-helix transcriptional regulator [Micrococcaceae bacterium]|nr:helix-turn-helix transcriptional regulator [Micrococcaceae bacterium]